MKLLLIGANSYVGARIFYDLREKYDIVGTFHNHPLSESFIKLDITEKQAINDTFSNIRPDMVIHVANYPSPSNVKNNEANFIKLNKNTTEYITQNANNIGAKVIFISSQAANNPGNDLYSELKLKSEEIIKTVKEGYLNLRPSLMVGFSPNTTNPRPFNRILKCLDDKSIIGEFDISWKLQPTYVGFLSQIIDKAITKNIWNETIPVFINEVVTQYQIAHDILNHFGVSVKEIDKHINIPLSQEDLTLLNSLNLFPHTYKEMISLIIEEIKERKKFVL